MKEKACRGIAFLNHMPLDDPYGATSALAQTVRAVRSSGCFQRIYAIAPGARDSVWDLDGAFSLKVPIEMNYIGALPTSQAWVWNKAHLARSKIHHVSPESHAVAGLLQGVDVIHLNSITLAWFRRFVPNWTLGQTKVVCHVREVLRGPVSLRLREDIARLDGFAFIDRTTQNAFFQLLPELAHKPWRIIPDVPDSNGPQETHLTHEIREWAGGRPIVGLAGRIDPLKGFSFMCNVVSQSKSDVVLVMAGRMGTSRIRRESWTEGRSVRRALTASPSRLMHVGEVPNLSSSGFYEAIHVLVRADEIPAAGLTVYEALARGIPVVLPGSEDDFVGHEQLDGHRHLIQFATPRDREAYMLAIQRAIAGPREVTAATASNLDVHAAELCDLYRAVGVQV